MGTSFRFLLADGSFVDWALKPIKPDGWRSHGVRYRIAWIQNEVCRVLFDNHHGRKDHMHIDGIERPYTFTSVEQPLTDFKHEVRQLGGRI